MNENLKYCVHCFYFEIKYAVGYYCNLHNKELGEWGLMDDACSNFELAPYTHIDVSGTGYETEIKNLITGKQYGVQGVTKLLNQYSHDLNSLQLRHHKVADTLQEYALLFDRDSKEFDLINSIGVELGYELEAKDD